MASASGYYTAHNKRNKFTVRLRAGCPVYCGATKRQKPLNSHGIWISTHHGSAKSVRDSPRIRRLSTDTAEEFQFIAHLTGDCWKGGMLRRAQNKMTGKTHDG